MSVLLNWDLKNRPELGRGEATHRSEKLASGPHPRGERDLPTEEVGTETRVKALLMQKYSFVVSKD